MIEVIGIISTILAVIGVCFNNRKMRVSFLIWMVSNALTSGIHAHAGLWSLFARDVIFLILAFEGWFRWGKKNDSDLQTS